MHALSDNKFGVVLSYEAIKNYASRNGFKRDEFLPSVEQVLKMNGIPISETRKSKAINLNPNLARQIWQRLLKDLDRSFFPSQFPKTEEGFIRHFLYPPTPKAGNPLDPADPGTGEIACVQPGSNLIPESAADVHSRVAVHVDNVAHRSSKSGGGFELVTHTFVRIEPPNNFDVHSEAGHGAVALPIDLARGRVLLVTQYRYARQKWMVEAPRGFANNGTERHLTTSQRETLEETGVETSIQEINNATVSSVRLGRFATDSGKLSEAPVHNLLFVDCRTPTKPLKAEESDLRYPVWVDFYPFFRAVFHGSSPVSEGELEVGKKTEATFGCRHLEEGLFVLEDSFTVLSGMRAWRHLLDEFRPTGAKQPAWLSSIQPDRILLR